MRRRDLASGRAHTPRGRTDRAVRRAPAEDERVGAVGIVDLELGDVGRDPGDLRRTQPHHPVVVLGVVRDVARLVLLLETADPVLEPGRPGNGPRTRERCGIAPVREEARLVVRLGRERRRDVGKRRDVGDQPRLGAVREVRVREQEDRRAVLHRDPRRLDRRVEATRGSRGRDDRHRRLGVPPEEHHQEVRLLGLRRHPRRRPGALDVDDEERQLQRHREPHRLRLQHDPRAGRGRHAERAAERRTERSPGGGDLVLGLERAHAEVLQLRELLEDVGRRRDRDTRRGRAATRRASTRRRART